MLTFSANTAFADFPRVCHFIAEDGYLPTSFTNRGRRLVYSEAIIVLAIITAAVLIAFGGITDRLIPLFAVGAFLAFTMSQAGMVAHWRRERGRGSRGSMWINAVGAVATGATVIIVIVAKFKEGAWITVIAIPSLLALMYGIHRHYRRVRQEINTRTPLETTKEPDPLIVIAMSGWTRVGKQALQFAMTLSQDIKVVEAIEESKPDDLREHWSEYVEKPTAAAGIPAPELVTLKSPYRFVITPVVNYVLQLAKDNPHRRVVIIVPELMEKRWYYYFLHTQRATLLKTRLLMENNDRISVLNIPWHLKNCSLNGLQRSSVPERLQTGFGGIANREARFYSVHINMTSIYYNLIAICCIILQYVPSSASALFEGEFLPGCCLSIAVCLLLQPAPPLAGR